MDVKLIGEYAVLKRITGLKTAKFKSRPSKFQVDKQSFSRKERDVDGEFLEEFKDNVIPGIITGLAPFWNDLKDTYWCENRSLLDDLVKKIKVRYPKNHDLSGKIIQPEDVDPSDFWDEFFQSDTVQSTRMEGGKYVFYFDKPLDLFLFYCYYHDPRVLVRDGRAISKAVAGKALYELIIPKTETLAELVDVEKNIDALTMLGAMSFEKQKYIAQIMKLKVNDLNNPDPDELKVAIGKAASSSEKSSKWNNLSGQDRYLQLATMNNNDLLLNLDIQKALDLRIVTSNRNVFELNNETLEGIDDKSKLFSFFKKDTNDEKYKDLIFLIKEKEKISGK